MDIMKSLKNVTNLNEYISVTQEVNRKNESIKIQINLTTVLTLKKIRSLEIEYMNKYEENGVACIILERLLALPPSKTWSVLGKELICLMQYWLEAIRKHLMNHSHNWWIFLRNLLIYIKDIRLKAPCMPNLLVEHTAECLLDLATADQPDASQRYEILHTFNMYCAESGREIRFAMRNKFSDYFVKLSTQMATCGYLPYQYSTLECLIRWLVPRQERSLRNAAANKWFPLDLYPQNAVQIFLHTNWMNFFQDARDFLNALNFANGLVTSVICRRLSIGNTHIISGSEKQQSWLDINTNDKSLSVLLDPRVLDRFESEEHRACEILHIHTDIIQYAQLQSENGITLSIDTTKAPSVRPSDISLGDEKRVTIDISTRTDLRKMDAALRDVFGDKYRALLDVNSQVSISPPRSFNKGKHDSYSEEDTRFSHPVEVKRKRHCGYISKSRNPGGVNTPSSVSTSSLAQLHEKLAALPRLQYDKEPVSVCAQPQLSSVTELSERDDQSINTTSTLKFRPYGVCHKNLRPYIEKKSQSDSETVKNRSKLSRTLSPVISDDNASLLLVATIEDNFIPNDTEPIHQHLSTSKKYDNQNIVDQLVQEALQTDKISDSGINTDENKKSQDTENSEAIEGTPVNLIEKPKRNRKVKNKVCTVVTTTDDESNTEVINETPAFVNVSNRRKDDDFQENQIAFDINTVENFFSQHFTENKKDEIVISPSLAKKINETSSESEIFEDNFNTDEEFFQFNDIEIIECLNDIVDKVCTNLDKYTECLTKEVNMENSNEIQVEEEPILTSTPKKSLNKNDDKPSKAKKAQPKRTDIKIKLRTPKKRKPKRVVSKKVKYTQPIPKMSTIVEQTEESVVEATKSVDVNIESPIIKTKCDKMKDTPINRRKRKLYSPKDDHIEMESVPKISDTDDEEVLANFKTKTKPTSSASCYKEIEKERKRYIRSKPRRSGKKIAEPSSPKTIQNNTLFDILKETVENTENIILADRNTNVEVYNFTSESEDEDFKKKKVDIKKGTVSSTTLTSINSTSSNRRTRQKNRVNYLENKSSNDEVNNKKTIVKRRQTKRKTKASKKPIIEVVQPVDDLIDERMRTNTDVLSTSIVINPPEQEDFRDIEPMIKVHEMESVEIETAINTTVKSQKAINTEIIKVKKEKATKNELKVKKNEPKPVLDKDEDRTISPLPGLFVEVAPEPKREANESLTTNMLQKFKKIYQEGPDVNETNTTQNILSDVERINNNSQQNISLSVTEQIYFAARDETKVFENNKRLNKGKLNNDTKRKSLEEYIAENDVMEICSIADRNSDVSIATDGITAHGDMEEMPPSPETIKHNIENREIVDLNQSMKEYFEKLNREMNKASVGSKELGRSNSIESVQKKKRKKSILSEKSLVVPVKRLSMEDMNKISIVSKDPRNSKSIKNIQENRLNKSSSSEKSPVISGKRYCMEDIRKYLPSRHSSETYTSNSQKSDKKSTTRSITQNFEEKDDTTKMISQKSNKKVVESPKSLSGSSMSPIVSIARISLEEFNKWLPPMPQNRDSDDTEPTQTQVKRNSDNLKTVFANDKNKLSPKKRERKPKATILETSQKVIKEKPVLRSYTKKIATSSQFDEISYKIPETTSNVTRKSNIISPVKSFEDFAQHLQSDHDSDGEYSKTIKTLSKTRSPANKKAKILEITQEIKSSKSPKMKGSISSLKRASSPIRKPRQEDTVTIESGHSVSSIHDWFKKSEPRIKDPSHSFNDAIQNIFEKLDTTLIEINKNTSKKLVKLFVEAQAYLDNQKEERRKIFSRLEEMDNEFMANLKDQAFELIKEDCKQKRTMVSLLKEDVQAGIEHVNTSKTSEY